MLTLLFFILLLSLIFGVRGDGLGSWSPAGLIVLIIVLVYFFGNGHNLGFGHRWGRW